LFAALSSACAQVGDAKVGVQPLEADVVFGVKEKVVPAAPVGFAPEAPADSVATLDAPSQSVPSAGSKRAPVDAGFSSDADNEGSGFSQDLPARPLPPARPPAPECRTAGVNDFPAQEATTFVTTERPEVGDYRFKREGTNQPTGSPFALGLSGFETRSVSDFVDRSPKASEGFVDYTWKTTQVDPLNRNQTIKTTYQMQRLDGQLAPSANGQRTGERGLTINNVERTEKMADGRTRSSTFTPSPRVLLLPVPVTVNESFNSVGVDAKSLDRLQVQGKIIGKQQVDACGERIDGWRVESTQTFNAEVRKVNYVIGMGIGGLVVLEQIDVTSTATVLKGTFTQGQVKPSAPTAAP